jgi:hypothetical protein
MQKDGKDDSKHGEHEGERREDSRPRSRGALPLGFAVHHQHRFALVERLGVRNSLAIWEFSGTR